MKTSTALLLSCLFSMACGDADPAKELDPDVAPVADGTWLRPAIDVTWQWQLTGTVNTTYDVDLYDVDLFDSPAELITSLQTAGRTVMCYFSAGSSEDWRSDDGKLDGNVRGETLDGWDGERWLDIRAQNVVDVMRGRLQMAADKGCDAVEPDNVDGYANDSGFDLTARDQLAFNRWLGNEAHQLGLGIALKNDGGQVAQLVDYFDMSLNEECQLFSECAELAGFTTAGKPILNAEYAASATAAQSLATTACPHAASLNLRTLILPLDLDDSFRVTCN